MQGKSRTKGRARSDLIDSDKNGLDQINFEKTSSIQKWNKLINKEFKKNLKIEGSKDREIIYSHMHSLGLPHERFMVFAPGHFPSKKEFEIAVGRMGFPYWISCPPDAKYNHLGPPI